MKTLTLRGKLISESDGMVRYAITIPDMLPVIFTKKKNRLFLYVRAVI